VTVCFGSTKKKKGGNAEKKEGEKKRNMTKRHRKQTLSRRIATEATKGRKRSGCGEKGGERKGKGRPRKGGEKEKRERGYRPLQGGRQGPPNYLKDLNEALNTFNKKNVLQEVNPGRERFSHLARPNS